MPSGLMGTANADGLAPNGGSGFGGAAAGGLGAPNFEQNYDFFDPQHWMLDGLLDFNYNNAFVQEMGA